MSIVAAAIGVGGTLLASSMASDSAADATAAQSQSAANANALSQAQFQQTREDNRPARLRGDAAGNRLAMLMGLSGEGVGGGGTKPVRRTADQLRSQLVAGFTKPPSGQQLVNPANSNEYRGEGAENYAQYLTAGNPGSIDEAGLAAAIERETNNDIQAGWQYDADQLANKNNPEYGSLNRAFSADDMGKDPIYSSFKPRIDASLQAGDEDLAQRRTYANSMLRNFGAADFEKEPGYEFRMQEGARGLENSAASRGGLLSGAALKAMQRFGQDFASNEFGRASDRFNTNRAFASAEYNNGFNRQQQNLNFAAGQADGAFNRFNTNQNNQFNRLSSMTGAGQVATNNVNSAGAQNAQYQGSNLIGAGNANAAASLAQGNNNANAIGNIANIAQGVFAQQRPQNYMGLIDQIRQPSGSFTPANSTYSQAGVY